jgi:ATP-dependent helicase/DNAse subunit B
LVDQPGFISVLQSVISDLKNAYINPEQFLEDVAKLGREARLRELALVYAAYENRLQEQGWIDRPGLGWLAVEAMELRAPGVGCNWPLLIVDGFDNFTEVQLRVLNLLKGRVGTFIITLTGPIGQDEKRSIFRRFSKTCQRLEKDLKLKSESLPGQKQLQSKALAHLEAHLFGDAAQREAARDTLTLVEAPDRVAEVRAAMRWLKEQLVFGGLPPGQVALVARNLAPYRPFIVQTAAEFGLPIRLVDGLPLRSNPAVAAVLDLLRLALPGDGGQAQMALSRRGVVEAWRSPYFDWTDPLPAEDVSEPIGIHPGDADALDAAGRWGRVIGGSNQWREVLAALAGRSRGESLDDEQKLPGYVVAGGEAQALSDKFERFLRRLTPPQGQQDYRTFVCWLEVLIGPDREAVAKQHRAAVAQRHPTFQWVNRPLVDRSSLEVVDRVREGEVILRGLDLAALQALKEILRGLIWAETSIGGGRRLNFSQFFFDLSGAVEATSYFPPAQPGRGQILVANVFRARAVPFRAVALLGLAEGEFPATVREDPFLRESDRDHLGLESSIESAERELFYEAITSPTERLLLTRPRLSDNGAEWLASPFWEEVQRLVDVQPIELTTESVPPPDQAASWPELMESLVTYPDHQAGRSWVREAKLARWSKMMDAGNIFEDRYAGGVVHTPFEGDLTGQAEIFRDYFNPGYRWSASSLEKYRTCPYNFFVGKVLHLEPREEPEEGLDAAQLGTIYHHILEALYRGVAPSDRNDLDKLSAALPAVSRRVLDQAPRKLGFRETAWWQHTRGEIEKNIAHSLVGLTELDGDFTPTVFEARFFGSDALVVAEGQDQFKLHGIIDRIDRNAAGQLRVIDYKTPGPYNFGKSTLNQGRKLQLPLYALAAEDALELGQLVEGFYWHVYQGQASGLKLADYGVEAAIGLALEFAWQAVRGARAGDFAPKAPPDGCPSYCPAAAFCWHYSPGFRV